MCQAWQVVVLLLKFLCFELWLYVNSPGVLESVTATTVHIGRFSDAVQVDGDEKSVTAITIVPSMLRGCTKTCCEPAVTNMCC